MRVHREWLQKHPTPRAADGDFHWYPGAAPELLAEIAAGATGALTLWIAPGSVIAARRFHAIAPGDGRRYAGLSVAIAAAAAADTAEMLARLPVPTARAWEAGAEAPMPRAAEASTRAPAKGAAEPRPADMAGGLSPSLVAALWRGGTCRGAIEGAPTLCAAIERWLPASVRATKRRIAIDPDDVDEVPADIADLSRWLAKAAFLEDAARARAERAWRAVAALAVVEGRSLESMFAELGALDRAAASAASLREYLAARGVAL